MSDDVRHRPGGSGHGGAKPGPIGSAPGSNGPTTVDDITISDVAYSQPGVGTTPITGLPDGLTILTHKNGTPIIAYDATDGFYGAAFETSTHHLVVGFEGTNFFTGSATFTAGQVIDDANLVAGTTTVASFPDALAFTKQVQTIAAARHLGPVYLTGHSLGAAEVEYVATKTGLAGTTFGAPGISSSFFKGAPPSRVINDVDIGDPVGNYNASSSSPINGIVLKSTILHYGSQVYAGYTNAESLAAYGSLVAANYAYTNYPNAEGVVATAGFLAAAVPDHLLNQYSLNFTGEPLPTADMSGSGAGALLGPIAGIAATALASGLASSTAVAAVTAVAAAGTAGALPPHSANAASAASFHSLVQAMATTSPGSASTMTPLTPSAPADPHPLAIAH